MNLQNFKDNFAFEEKIWLFIYSCNLQYIFFLYTFLNNHFAWTNKNLILNQINAIHNSNDMCILQKNITFWFFQILDEQASFKNLKALIDVIDKKV